MHLQLKSMGQGIQKGLKAECEAHIFVKALQKMLFEIQSS